MAPSCQKCRHYEQMDPAAIAKVLGDRISVPLVRDAFAQGEITGGCQLRRELVGATPCDAYQNATLYRIRRFFGRSRDLDRAAAAYRKDLELQRDREADDRARRRLQDAHAAVRQVECTLCQRRHVECRLCRARPVSCGQCTACGGDVVLLNEHGGWEWRCRKCHQVGLGLPALIQYADRDEDGPLCEGCAEHVGVRARGVMVCIECARGLGLSIDASMPGAWKATEKGTCTDCRTVETSIGRVLVKRRKAG